jgi:hypothetical protein
MDGTNSMTLTLTILLGFFLGVGLILAISLSYLERQKWMRMFSEKQGIPVDIMEGKDRGAQAGALPPRRANTGRVGDPGPGLQSNKDHRKRFPVPIPGADWMRNPANRRDRAGSP